MGVELVCRVLLVSPALRAPPLPRCTRHTSSTSLRYERWIPETRYRVPSTA